MATNRGSAEPTPASRVRLIASSTAPHTGFRSGRAPSPIRRERRRALGNKQVPCGAPRHVYTSGFNRNNHGGEQVTISKHFGRGAAALGALVLVVAACSSGSASSAPASAQRRSPQRRRGSAAPSSAAGGDKPTLAFIATMQTRPRPSPGRCTRRMPTSTASTSSTSTTRATSRQQTAAINSAVAQKVAGHRHQPR